jgi:hypothetical protein
LKTGVRLPQHVITLSPPSMHARWKSSARSPEPPLCARIFMAWQHESPSARHRPGAGTDSDKVLTDIAPITYEHINLRGILTFDLSRFSRARLANRGWPPPKCTLHFWHEGYDGRFGFAPSLARRAPLPFWPAAGCRRSRGDGKSRVDAHNAVYTIAEFGGLAFAQALADKFMIDM